MPYKLLADITVLVHFLWIIFLISGAIPGRKWRVVKIIHISGLSFAFFIEVFGLYCPLTHLEVFFRSRHDPSAYYIGGFIIHYLERLIYIQVPRLVIILLTISLCLLNLWIYTRRPALEEDPDH